MKYLLAGIGGYLLSYLIEPTRHVRPPARKVLSNSAKNAVQFKRWKRRRGWKTRRPAQQRRVA